jgi:dolichol kinase
VFQIAIGAGFLVIALVFKQTFKTAFIVVYLVLAAYIYNKVLMDYGKRTKIYRRLFALERERTVYGLGAMYASAGLLLLSGFLNSYNFIALGIFALFIGDPLATIVGHSLKLGKLPYNNRKSISGTLALFLATMIFGYFMIGVLAVPVALALAFFESIDVGVDDNIMLPVVTIAANLIILLI